MKKKITKEMEVEVMVCNICGIEVEKLPFNQKRIEIVRHLFNTSDFHAHEGCINTIVKDTFSKFINQTP